MATVQPPVATGTAKQPAATGTGTGTNPKVAPKVATGGNTPVSPVAATSTQAVHPIVTSTLIVIYVANENEYLNGTIGKFVIIFDQSTGDIYRASKTILDSKNDSIGVLAAGTVKTLATGAKAILKKLA